MHKKGGVVFFIFLVSFLLAGFVSADNHTSFDNGSGDFGEKRDGSLRCLACGDSCAPYDFVVVAECPSPTNGEPECGVENGECIVLGFEEEFENEDDDFNEEWLEEAEDFDEELQQEAGTTPGSAFYFLDEFLDNIFSSDLEVREERIAEMRDLAQACDQGDEEACRNLKEAFEKYKEHAERFAKEVSPDEQDEARRSSRAIRGVVIREIAKSLPPGEKDEFVREIVKSEKNIETAAEIANKIRELCVQLADLDPELFYDSCKVGEEGPRWHKKMYEDLTDEQKTEAKKFAKIMKQCFRTSGQECACEEIPFTEFANMCSVAAPLATLCEIEGDESACEELDDLEMPELPPHLQDIMDELEGDVAHEKFDLHMPPECREAGATTPKECSKIMIQTHAPPECKQALLDSGCDGEFECRGICEKIMMEKYAPECVEQGITAPEECKDFMWNIDRRPPECVDNQIHDYRDCKRFLEEGRGFRPGEGPGINFDCREIEDPIERLDCFDKASSGFRDFHDERGFGREEFCLSEEEFEARVRDCKSSCPDCRWSPEYDNSGPGSHQCVVDIECKRDLEDFEDKFEEHYEERYGDYYSDSHEESECKDGCSQECPGASRTDCVDNGMRCECYYEDNPGSPPSETTPPSTGEGEGAPQTDTTTSGEGTTTDTSGTSGTTTGGDNTGVDASPPDSESSSTSEPSDSSVSSGGDNSGGDSETTGTGAFITGNAFLDYWFD